jgi:nitrite reductase/ring-hydroxylating ferredoxin subunit
VELLAVEDESTVRLRLLGTCDGCPSSSVTLKLAVEGAIEAAAPEITAIEVETRSDDPTGPLIPAESLTSHLHGPDLAGSWQGVPELLALQPGGVLALQARQTPMVACRLGEDLYAFLSECPRCGADLAAASLARRLGGAPHDALLVCPGCQAHFDVRRAGACLDVPALHLEPLPLLRDNGGVSVAVPRPVPS